LGFSAIQDAKPSAVEPTDAYLDAQAKMATMSTALFDFCGLVTDPIRQAHGPPADIHTFNHVFAAYRDLCGRFDAVNH